MRCLPLFVTERPTDRRAESVMSGSSWRRVNTCERRPLRALQDTGRGQLAVPKYNRSSSSSAPAGNPAPVGIEPQCRSAVSRMVRLSSLNVPVQDRRPHGGARLDTVRDRSGQRLLGLIDPIELGYVGLAEEFGVAVPDGALLPEDFLSIHGMAEVACWIISADPRPAPFVTRQRVW
jgi:hypothetical protein